MNRRLASILAASVISAAVVAVLIVSLVVRDGSPAGADATDPEMVREGQALYATYCAACHGANLEGESNWMSRNEDGTLRAPPHDGTGHTWHHTDAQLFEITKFGTAAVVPGVRSNMAGFGESLSDAEIWAVLAFIKSRWPQEIQQTHARRERDLAR